MTTSVEAEIMSAAPTEHTNCDICKKEQIHEDIFPAAFQDPQTNIIAMLRVCRICLVTNFSLVFRKAIYEYWNPE